MYKPVTEQPFKPLCKALPFLIFIISATFSGFGAYDYYIEANPVLAKVIAAIFGGIGIAFSISIIQFEFALKLIKCRITAFLLGLFMVAYLGVGSLYNYSFLAMTQAVDSELDERAVSADHAFTPIITNSAIINTSVLPLLDTFITRINNDVAQQEQLGGCYQICILMKDIYRELDDLNNQLASDYSEDNTHKLNKTLVNLTNLSLQKDITWQEKISNFNELFFDLKAQSNQFLTKPLPADVLDHATMRFKAQENRLNALTTHYSPGSTGYDAFWQAKAELADIQKVLTEVKGKVLTVKREPIYFTPVTTSFLLLLKQWKHSADRLVIAFFLDALGIALILSNITVYRKINL